MKTLVAAALLARWICLSAFGQEAPPLEPNDVMTVAVTSAMPVAADITDSYLGMTYYYGNFHKFMGDRPLDFNPVMVRLLQNLADLQGPPLIRTGGGSVNETWYDPDGSSLPMGIKYDLTPNYLEVIADTLAAAGSKGIFCLNVGFNDIGIFEGMGNGIRSHVGDSLIAGFEIGNEPNRYGPNGQRTSAYDFDIFSDEFDAFLTAYETNVSDTIPALGPTFTMTGAETVGDDLKWNARALEFITRFQSRLGTYSMSRYPLSDCTDNPAALRFPSIPNVLKDWASEGQAVALEPNVIAAHNASLPFYIVEDNSASCGGTEGVSDTFASALWFIDSAFAYANRGVDKLFVSSSSSEHYSPFLFDGNPSDSGLDPITYTPEVFPIYYGMLFFAEAVGEGCSLREIDVKSPEGVNTKAWATIDDEGSVRVILLNKDLNESGNVRIYVPGSHAEASLTRLTAPFDDATSGVLLGGQTFDGSLDGVALGTRAEETIVPNSNGIYTVFLDRGSAALLTLPIGGNADLGAGAGFDQTVLIGDSVMLDGSDSYGTIDTYSWVQMGGPATRLLDANAPSSQFTPYDAGVYTFALTVGNSGGSAIDTVEITVGGQSTVIYIEAGGEVAFEAEAPSQIQPGVGGFINHTWTIVSDGDASDGQYMECTPDDFINARETADGPALEFRILFSAVGSYQVHVRTSREDLASDSFHVGLESPVSYPKGLKASDDWGWETEVNDTTGAGNAATVEILSPGEHTFRIWPREDGCRVDRVVLSANTITDLDGLDVSGVDQSDLTISARERFDSAALTSSLTGNDAEALAMPHGDGLPNLLKYAFNMDLEEADSRTMDLDGDAGLPGHEIVQNAEGETVFRVSFLRRRGSGLIYSPMRLVTSDLDHFVTMIGQIEIIEVNTDWDRVAVSEICDASTARCFAHVRVSFP